MRESYPICRAMLRCPICGREKAIGLVMCWSCWHEGKNSDLVDRAQMLVLRQIEN